MISKRVAVIKVDNPHLNGLFDPITKAEAGIRVPMRVVNSNLRSYFKTKDFELFEVPNYTNCFRCRVKGSEEYHIKLFTRDNPEILVALKSSVQGKTYIHIYENVVLGITPWYPLKQLFETIEEGKEFEYGENVKVIAKEMHDLHQTTLRTTPFYRHEMEKVYKILNPLKNLKDVHVILDYLKTFDLPVAHSLIHTDIQPKNILIGENDGHIIDYENAQVGHPYDDFAYLMLTMDDHPAFLKALVNEYFEGNIPEDFFKLNSYFTCLKYLLILAETYNKIDLDVINENTRIIIEEFVNREVPSWWN